MASTETPSEEPSSSWDKLFNSIGHGGRGGRGGSGGTGGAGGGGNGSSNGNQGKPGEAGKPGESGEPGEPGRIASVSGVFNGTISITALVTVVLAILAGITYIIDIKNEVALLRKDFQQLDDNIKNLNTPLSQRVFAVEARTNEIGRIQQEVRARIESIDANGTTQNKILKRDVDTLRTDVMGQNVRCQEAVRRIDELQRESLENKLRIQNIIEAIAPHEVPRRK